jgi:hypothetical protein
VPVESIPQSDRARQQNQACPAPHNSPAAVKSTLVALGQSALDEGDWRLVCLVDFILAAEGLSHV